MSSSIFQLQQYFFGANDNTAEALEDVSDVTDDKSETNNESEYEWQLIGLRSVLKKRRCRRLYAENGMEDVALYYTQDNFYATLATCPHSGGPLDELDDIEELDKMNAVCPLHLIAFDIRTGNSDEGYKVKTCKVKEEDGYIYVKHNSNLNLIPASSKQSGFNHCHKDISDTVNTSKS